MIHSVGFFVLPVMSAPQPAAATVVNVRPTTVAIAVSNEVEWLVTGN